MAIAGKRVQHHLRALPAMRLRPACELLWSVAISKLQRILWQIWKCAYLDGLIGLLSWKKWDLYVARLPIHSPNVYLVPAIFSLEDKVVPPNQDR